ncbi:hypothetical protein HC749_06180 [Arthrobacter sp. S13_S34]|nr:hypothetical protein [Arthrobacter sp. S13_S34]
MGNLLERKPAPAQALVCTLAVALMLAGTRWGSYIGYAPLFLTDVLIAAAVVDRFLIRTGRGRAKATLTGKAQPTLLFTVFFVYVAFRGLFSAELFTMTWVRDIMPFLYGALAFLSAGAYASSTTDERKKTMKLLWWALLFHLAWVSVVTLGRVPGALFPLMPRSDVPFLSTRPDVDMAFLGLTAALLLRRLIRGECNRFWGSVGLLLAVVTTASMHSRAGLISLALALALSFGLTYANAGRRSDRRLMMIMAVPVALAVSLAGLAQTTPGERLLASITSTSTGSLNEQSARGTERARELTWDGVIGWTFEGASRPLVGGGFGNDFLAESGVLQFLEGTQYTSVRSPHNWFIGVLARTGTIGLVLILGVLLSTAGTIYRNRRRVGEDETLTTAAIGLAVLIPVGALGVVLESPFGAVPFWWFLGILMTMHGMKDEPLPRRSHLTRRPARVS